MKRSVWFVFVVLIWLAPSFGQEVTERARLGAVVEALTYVDSGPLAGKVVFVDGWTAYVHDPDQGGYDKLFSFFGSGFQAQPRGIAYLSQGEFAGLFLVSDAVTAGRLSLVSRDGAVIGAVLAQGFQWSHTEGMTQITSGSNQGQVAMIAQPAANTPYHVFVFRLQESGGEIHATLEKDIPDISTQLPLGIAYLPSNFPDPAFADMFAVSEEGTAALLVIDRQGNRVASFPGIAYGEGLTYISGGGQAGRLLLADMTLQHPFYRNLDGSASMPAAIPPVGIGLFGILNFTWLKERQQLHVIQWDGHDFNVPATLISRQAAGLWQRDQELRLTHFRLTRNITHMTADGCYRQFGVITPRGVPARWQVDRLASDFTIMDSTPLASEYAGMAFGILAYVPGETSDADRYVAPLQKAIYSFDSQFRFPAAVTDLSAVVENNISKMCYDPAVQRFYVLDGTFLRVFDSAWAPVESFDLLEASPGPYGAIDKITSGEMKGNVAILNGSDNELIIFNFDTPIVRQQLEDLAGEVAAAGLPGGLANSLLHKLKNAEKSLARKHYATAMNQLEAFMNEVRAQGGKKIPASTAALWLAQAENILCGIEQFL